MAVAAACKKPVTQGQWFAGFAQRPSITSAMTCVASYEEFCSAYGFPQGQRNRQWIQRLRRYTAQQFYKAYKDHLLLHPKSLRQFIRKRPLYRIRPQQVLLTFCTRTDTLRVNIYGCRLTPSGRLLPCKPLFTSVYTSPKRGELRK